MRVVVVLLLALLLAARPAAADGYEETEHRLKTAGIDEETRERIHDAIRRGVAWLRAQQAEHAFVQTPGHVALVGLALRHAAIPQGVEGAHEALRWIERTNRRTAAQQTYTAGLLAMLLLADGSGEPWNREIHDLLAKGPRSNAGYWGYLSGGGDGTPNLSTAQFACLGLWAGERAGAPVASRAWRLHLAALREAQDDDGSWGYAPRRGPEFWRTTYPTGTFMGLADLTLAHRAIREEIEEEPRTHARTLLAEGAARAALRRHVAWETESSVLAYLGSSYPFYRLYALEKVCVFLDLEEVAGRRWYRMGAERLLRSQAANGGWNGTYAQNDGPPAFAVSDVVNTSFALLFLLRASESYRPVTPRPVDRPPVITPGDDPTPPAPRRDPPTVTLEEAEAVLDDFAAWLARPRLDTPGRALETFRAVLRIHPDYRERGGRDDAWCRRAEDLLLAVSVRFVDARSTGRETWQAVAIEALDVLATTDRRVAPRLMRAVERMERNAAFTPKVQTAWFSAALDALRRLEAPALAPWLTSRCLSPDPKERALTSAALTTLGGIRDLRGIQRHAAAQAVVVTLAPLFRRSGGDAATRDLLRDLLVVLHRLAGPGAEDFPTLADGVLGDAMSGLRAWWRAHGARSDPTWSD